ERRNGVFRIGARLKQPAAIVHRHADNDKTAAAAFHTCDLVGNEIVSRLRANGQPHTVWRKVEPIGDLDRSKFDRAEYMWILRRHSGHSPVSTSHVCVKVSSTGSQSVKADSPRPK